MDLPQGNAIISESVLTIPSFITLIIHSIDWIWIIFNTFKTVNHIKFDNNELAALLAGVVKL